MTDAFSVHPHLFSNPITQFLLNFLEVLKKKMIQNSLSDISVVPLDQ